MPRQRRQGIVYDVREKGTARLVFDEQRTKFEGMLETISGETMLVRGQISTHATASTSDNGTILMDLDVVDGEEGSVFHVRSVEVRVDEQCASIDSEAVKFDSQDRHVGMRAAVEIQQFINPDLAEECKEVFVGHMEVNLLTSERPTQSIRKESICGENSDIKILEVSDDFLA